MRSIRRSHVPAALTAVLLLQAVAIATAFASDQCSRESLSPRLIWLSSAIWIPSVDKILAVDPAANELLLYAPDGKGTVIPEPKGEKPSLLTTAGDRVLLKLFDRAVVSLDAKTLGDAPPARVLTSFLKSATTSLGGGPLNAVYQWVGTDQSVLAFGLVRGESLPRGYQPGLFRVPFGGSSAPLDPLLKVYDWDYYLLGYQYLTAIGNTGYFLDLDQGTAKLYEVPSGAAPRLLPGSVPADFRDVPQISAFMRGPKDAPPLYKSLERMKMVTGLYGNPRDGRLYLLAREPAARGAMNWWLFRINPEGGKVEGKALLPTNARHLSVVVSPDTFYLIERGEVNAYGGQEIDTLVAVPTTLLERATLQGTAICPRLRE
jgi:hypothetical protein